MPPDGQAEPRLPPPGLATAGLLAPAYLWMTLAVFLPLAAMLYFSVLTRAPFGPRPASFTLENYLAFVRRPYLLRVAWTSVSLGLWTTGLCALLGWPAALALANAVGARARGALFLLIVLPFWTNGLVRIFSWTMVLSQGGLLDATVRAIFPGLHPGEILYSYPAIVIGLVHAYLPYMVLTSYVSLASINPSIIEAAQSLGARMPVLFARVLLPLSLPGLLSGAVLIFVPVLGSFMEPRILGGRVGVTMGTVIEDQFTQAFNWPLGAALSFTMLALVLAAFALPAAVMRLRPAS
jgi:spermidine/putrescine transport system permease protein